MKDKDQVFLLLGGNLGNVPETFRKARAEINRYGRVIRQSSLYATQPWGMREADDFINQALLITTDLSPQAFMVKIQLMEKELGRVRPDQKSGENYHSRTLDIDILLWGHEIIQDENLTVPHPRMHLRNFTLVPLNEIAPGFEHPVLNRSVAGLLENCEDTLAVRKL